MRTFTTSSVLLKIHQREEVEENERNYLVCFANVQSVGSSLYSVIMRRWLEAKIVLAMLAFLGGLGHSLRGLELYIAVVNTVF